MRTEGVQTFTIEVSESTVRSFESIKHKDTKGVRHIG